MAGFWPSCFLCVPWTEMDLRSMNMQKKRKISSHLDQTSLLNKGFTIRKKNTIFLQDTAGNFKLARKSHLAHLGSQSKCRILFILPAHRDKTTVSLTWTISISPPVAKTSPSWSPNRRNLFTVPQIIGIVRCVLIYNQTIWNALISISDLEINPTNEGKSWHYSTHHIYHAYNF